MIRPETWSLGFFYCGKVNYFMENTPYSWKRTLWAKLIAACFIGLIILGNIWLVESFRTKTPAFWIQVSFIILVGSLIVLGGVLGADILLRKVLERDERDSQL